MVETTHAKRKRRNHRFWKTCRILKILGCAKQSARRRDRATLHKTDGARQRESTRQRERAWHTAAHDSFSELPVYSFDLHRLPFFLVYCGCLCIFMLFVAFIFLLWVNSLCLLAAVITNKFLQFWLSWEAIVLGSNPNWTRNSLVFFLLHIA